MVVNIKRELNLFIKQINSRYKNRLRLGISGYSQLFFYSFLFCYPSYSYATPNLRGVVGGNSAATVNTQGLTTNVNQFQSSVIIDWNSLNLAADEKLAIHQLSTDTLLNRIHSATATDIYGQITGAGTNLFVNPNGVFFRPGSRVDVGALIASGLQISNSDFLNGDYIFNEMTGTDGFVINSGLINASLGGSVTLLGKSVTNDGVISAQLGSVNLAAGKAAVLTFDQQGLLGVQVTEAILQDELGIDPAVLNSGEINAEGGKVLLTASVSQDVFSQAVNSGDIEQATSVVVNEDGTFTLGAGADVINTGTVDASANDLTQEAGKIVVLGENVTSSGIIKADADNAKGGEIELHATNTALLTEDSITSARSESSSTGGVVKVLGNHVGLFDQSTVDVSGATGGGQALIGGDFQGKNSLIRNANRTIINKDVTIYNDAIDKGNGGKTIIWANDYTLYFGSIYSRGGINFGDGGFTEVSGKEFLDYSGLVDSSSLHGKNGTLLLDPRNIEVVDTGNDSINRDNLDFEDNGFGTTFITSDRVEEILASNSLELNARSDILITDDIIITSARNLTLQAGDDIEINNNISLGSGDLKIIYDHNGCTGSSSCINTTFVDVAGNSLLLNADLSTSGGDIIIGRTGSTETAWITGTDATRTISTGTGGGKIEFFTEILNSNTVNPNSLVLEAGTGDVIFNSGADVGSTSNSLSKFEIQSANTIELRAVTTQTAGIDITGNEIRLYNNLASNQGGTGGIINLNGAVVLYNDIALNSGGGQVTFHNNVISTDDNSNSLTITAGAGDVVFNSGANAGTSNTDNLGMLNIISADEVTLRNVQTGYVSGTNNGIDITANTVNLNNEIRTDRDGTSGNIKLTGNVLLHNNVTMRTSGGFVNVTGTINANSAATNSALNVFTNSGNITFEDAIGTSNNGRLDSFIVSSANDIILGTTGAGGGLTADIVTITTSGTAANSFNTNGFDIITAGTDGDVGTATTGGNVGITVKTTLDIGAIDASGGDADSTADANGLNGGQVDLTAAAITVGVAAAGDLINTSGGAAGNNATNVGGAGGIVNLTAIADFLTVTDTVETESITLIADVDSRAGLDNDGSTRAAQATTSIVLEADASSISGVVNLENDGDYTSVINITGTTDNEILTRLNGTNTNAWDIDAANSGNINTSNIIFTSIESLIGGEGVDNFDFNNNNNGSISGLIDGGTNSVANDTNDTLDFSLSNQDVSVKLGSLLTDTNLYGNAFTDINNIETLTGNNGQANSLTGSDNTNTWRINASDGGAVTDGTGLATEVPVGDVEGITKFTDFENLTGGINTDNFIVESAGNISGLIDGGSDGAGNNTNDILNLDAKTGAAQTVQLNIATPAAANNVYTIDNIETLSANNGQSNTLTAENQANTWRINVTNGGAVSSTGGLSSAIPGPTEEGVIKFTDFENLTGGTNIDNFIVENAGDINGLIDGGSDGGAANTNDILNLDAKTGAAQTVQLNTAALADANNVYTIDNIETLSANNGQSNTLIAENLANTWRINVANGGAVSSTGGLSSAIPGPTEEGVIKFTDFENLTGGTNTDNFIVETTGDVNGLIDGGSDGGAANTNDILNLDLKTGAALTVQLDTTASAAANDVFTIDNIETLSANNGQLNTLIARNLANTWRINVANGGAVTDGIGLATAIPVGDLEGITKFTNFVNLTGGTNADNFIVEITGDISGLIDGGNDGGTGNTNDILNLDAKTGAAQTVQLDTTASAAANNVFTIDKIETLSAINGQSNTLTADNVSNTWIINDSNIGAIGTPVAMASGIPGGTVEGVTKFTSFNTFNGGTGIDVFEINGANVNATIDGGGGTAIDELIGFDFVNNWSLNASGVSHTLSATGLVSFDGVENITGGTFNDTFIYSVSGVFAGIIDGGDSAGGIDTIDVSALTDVSISLDTTIVSAVDARISNIEIITAAVGNNNLYSDNINTKWIIDAQDSGAVGDITTFTQNAVPITAVQGVTKFSNFNTLNGGTGADQFILTTETIATAMTFNGGSSATINAYDTLALGNTANPFNISSEWEINDTDSGVLYTPTKALPGLTINFNGIENLTGGIDNDTFTFLQPGTVGSLRGLIDAGANLNANPGDTINYSGLTNAITLEFITDPANATNTSVDQIYVNNIETIGGNNGSSFTGSTGQNDWSIETSNSGYVINSGFRINYTGVDTLIGNTGIDNFVIIDDIDFTGSISGGNSAGVADTLTAFARATNNTWGVTLNNASGIGVDGTLNSTNFQGIESLIGNSTNDTFNISAGVTTGTINGFIPGDMTPETGVDTIFAAAEVLGNAWTVSSNYSGDLNGINFTGMEVLNGSTTADDFSIATGVTVGTFNGHDPLQAKDAGINSITAAAEAGGNSWSIDGNYNGVLNTNLTFNGMDSLNGNTTNDNFVVSTTSNFLGTVSGGAGGGTDKLTSFANAAGNTWNLDDWNNDTLSGALNTDLQFTGFENLEGNTTADTFNLHDTVIYSGTIAGNAVGATETATDKVVGGNRSNTWTVIGSESGNVTGLATTFTDIEALEGNVSDDTFNLDSVIEFNGSIAGNAVGATETAADTIAGSNRTNIWTVTGAESGNVTGLASTFTDIELLQGNNAADTFNLASGITFMGDIAGNLVGATETANDTVVGANATNVWTITDAETGTVTGLQNAFADIEVLIGGTAGDTFNLNATNDFTGTIAGNAVGATETATDKIVGANQSNVWTITGSESGTVTGLTTTFTDIEALEGNVSDDTFNLDNVIEFNGSIAGNAIGATEVATDILIAGNRSTNIWTVTGAGAGTVSGLGGVFSSIETLNGRAQVDTFTIEAAGSISGAINGGDGIDTLDFETNGVTVYLNADNTIDTSPTAVFNAVDFEHITALASTNPSNFNSLFGQNVKQLWVMDANDQGAVGDSSLFDGTGTPPSGIPVADTLGIVKFENFNNITGGSNDDAFRQVNGATATGTLTGGDHIIGDTIDQSQLAVVTVQVSNGTGGTTGIEGYTGNGYNSTIIATNTDNTWTLSDVNRGTVLNNDDTNPETQSFTFEGFNILVGGSDVDAFIVESGGSIAATQFVNGVTSGIFGGDGNDSLTVNLDAATSSGRVYFDGQGGGSNSISLNTIATSVAYDTAVYTPNAIVNYNFVNLANGTSYDVDFVDANANTVTDNVNATKLIVNGTTSNDTITFDSTTFSVIENITPTTFTEVTYSNKNGIDIIAGNGASDVINLGGDINFTNDVMLSAETLSSTGFTTTATTLALDTVQLTTSPMLTNVDNLVITNSDAVNATNNINIQEADSVAITNLELNGTLTLVADANITQSASALNSAALLDLTATNGEINLGSATNALTGRLNLSAANDLIALTNSGNTILGDVTTNDILTVTTNGSITDAGVIDVNSAVLDAGTGAITLDSNANNFGALSVTNANAIVIVDTDDIQLGNINFGSGVFTLTAGAGGVTSGVTQQNGSSINQAVPPTGLGGAVTFNINDGEITLDQSNQFSGAVALNNSGVNDVIITDVDALVFGLTSIGSGSFTVNSSVLTVSTGVSQIAGITQQDNAGIMTINAGLGGIDLTSATNDFKGGISLNNNSANAVSLTNANDVALLQSSVGGSFDIISFGANGITQGVLNNEQLTVVGNASFSSNANTSIVLANQFNNFQSGVSFSSNSSTPLMDVTIANSGALDLGDITVSNNLDVITGGEISNDSGSLIVGGVAWFDASGNNVTLNDQANNFNDIVFVNAATVNATDIDNINIGSSVATRENSVVLADLNVTSLNGDITDVANSALTVGGLTSLTAGSLASAGTVELNETANEFNQVNIINAQDVTLFDLDTDANGIDLRSTNIIGNLDVISTGDITNSNDALSGALVVNGTSTFTTADAGNIQLNNAANELTGALTFSATTNGVALDNVGIVNTLATNINALNITTDLNITSGGAITQNAAFTVGNLTTLDAINTSTLVPQDIILDSPNNLNLLSILNANNVTIKNATNTLSIDQLNAAGAIDIMSGALTIAGDIVASSVALDSGAGLTNIASIDTSGSLGINSEGLTVTGILSAGDAIINAGGAVAAFLGDVTTGSTLDIAANGLTINGAIITGGNTVLDSTTGVANLNNSITVSTGDLTVNGNGINQADNILVQNDVIFNSTQGIAMDATSSTTATDGNIQFNADNTVNVGLLSALNGTAGVSTSANIVDANGDLTNFLAINMVTRTGTGMGTGDGSRINTRVETMDVINSGSGSLWIDQTGGPEISELEIIALQNDTVRTIATDPGGITNIRADESFLINPNSVVVDRDTGILFMTSVSGGFSGTGLFVSGTDPLTDPDGSLINPDFTGNQVTFFALNGDFGSSFRPLVLNVPKVNNSIPGEDSFIFIDSVRVAARYFPDEPDNLTTTGIDVSALGVLSAIAGELLVEIETLGDIDPAIFTDLQNYSLQDISIRMPRDQLFEDELEEEGQLQ